nr:MAG TPA: YopX protein [Caudoviricetes sp.]
MIPKFRAWHHELGRMMSISDMWFNVDSLGEIGLDDAVMNDYITVSPDEIELTQSTGLKDKNGKEIFEGDIVDYKGRKAVVKWHGSYASFIYRFVDELQERVSEWHPLFLAYYHFEIIGNIHENPELLEVKE